MRNSHFEKYFIFGNETLFIFIYQQPKKIKGLRPVVEKEAKVERVNIFILELSTELWKNL